MSAQQEMMTGSFLAVARLGAPDRRAEKGLQTKPSKRRAGCLRRAMKGLEASRIGLHLGDFAERLGALGDAQIWPPGAF